MEVLNVDPNEIRRLRRYIGRKFENAPQKCDPADLSSQTCREPNESVHLDSRTPARSRVLLVAEYLVPAPTSTSSRVHPKSAGNRATEQLSLGNALV
jgi:hypothetical protein